VDDDQPAAIDSRGRVIDQVSPTRISKEARLPAAWRFSSRAVIYLRYSSDNQRETSLADQLRICKERVAREGWTLVQVFRDAALSGATVLRPGYQALLEAARDGGFDVLVAEALDRLSRD
jgi:predicted site-specific integrase-resolvase